MIERVVLILVCLIAAIVMAAISWGIRNGDDDDDDDRSVVETVVP